MNLVKIDFDRCKECHYCVKFCPKKIIAAGDKINKQGYYTPVIENMDVRLVQKFVQKVQLKL